MLSVIAQGGQKAQDTGIGIKASRQRKGTKRPLADTASPKAPQKRQKL